MFSNRYVVSSSDALRELHKLRMATQQPPQKKLLKLCGIINISFTYSCLGVYKFDHHRFMFFKFISMKKEVGLM